eukprot:jgi/Botrbrau1/21295/Bobra.0184s0008.1
MHQQLHERMVKGMGITVQDMLHVPGRYVQHSLPLGHTGGCILTMTRLRHIAHCSGLSRGQGKLLDRWVFPFQFDSAIFNSDETWLKCTTAFVESNRAVKDMVCT